MIITIRLAALQLARAELSKLLTTRALPASFAIAIVLAVGSVIIRRTHRPRPPAHPDSARLPRQLGARPVDPAQ